MGGSLSLIAEFSDRPPVALSGIAAENLERVFEPFERIGADRRGVEGTGIGLAISKRLVELMGGEISVRSVVGQGSTFRVELPRMDGVEAIPRLLQAAPDTRILVFTAYDTDERVFGAIRAPPSAPVPDGALP